MVDNNEEKENNSKDDLHKTLFVHEKIVEFSNSQQKAIDYLNNKLNWIIVADVALLGFLISKSSCLSGFQKKSFFLVAVSLLFAVCSIWSKKYSQGPKLKELIEKSFEWPHEKLVMKFNKKLETDITNNEKISSELALWFKFSIIFLIAGVVLLVLSI
ncbi:MAG: hypothetical protein NT136_02300 [Candidatus Moranbacteria bacterium]|nr:hypothetical protein [Candidatus Moranbacteria bacterium]